MRISAVINTKNEEHVIDHCLESLTWADEIIVVDNASDDSTAERARKYTDHVYIYEKQHGYVEPIRNFAIEKATGDFILIVDADEYIPSTLADRLKEIAANPTADYYEIPRKNVIFSKWMEHTGWWPDYNIRYFKKGKVTWPNEIHIPPTTSGNGAKLEPQEQLAIVHNHYQFVSQYLSRLNRYTDIQACEVAEKGYTFSWPDIIRKPLSEFLTRFFAWEGYKDGLHGLVLSLLQAYSMLIVYSKVWEMQGFQQVNEPDFLIKVANEGRHVFTELSFWFRQKLKQKGVKSFVKKFIKK